MKKNIFVIGLDPFNLERMRGIRQADEYEFHSLLDYNEVVKPLDYPYEEMLKKAEQRLRDFSGSIDGITSHWDFPADTMLPVLCQKFGLPSPSLEDVLKCGHKYWARLEQAKCIPDHIPDFCAVDPFAGDPLSQVKLDFPFWIKPVKSFGSYLGFRIDNEEDFNEVLPIIRKNIRRIGDPFNFVLSQADLPSEVEGIGGNHCIAESIIPGERQNGPEGYVYNGDVVVYGITDSVKGPKGSFVRYEYPSVWPEKVKQESNEVTRRLVEHIGLDNSAFNLEFIWDEKSGSLQLIEINPRISQSLSDMFEKVHGVSNHQVVIDLSMGRRPDFSERRGPFNCAAKFMWRHYQDEWVERVPSEAEIQQVKDEFPGTHVHIEVEPGMKLSDLRDQDSYSYEIAILLMGAENHAQLLKNYKRAQEILGFEFSDASTRSYQRGNKSWKPSPPSATL